LHLTGTVRYQNFGNVIDFQNFDNVFLFPDIAIGESGFLNSSPSSSFVLVLGFSESTPKDTGTSSGSPHVENNLCSFADFTKKVLSQRADLGIWIDPLKGRISLYRESFGSVPLFYMHKPGIDLIFSTSISSLLKSTSNSPNINVGKIVQYSDFAQPMTDEDPSVTFFHDIKAVLPGHIATIDDKGIVSTPVFVPETSKWGVFKRPEEFAEITRTVQLETIGRLIPQTGNIGSHLSGGLDSSSIISTVRFLDQERSIHTFHLTAESTETDERLYAQQVSDAIRSTHHLIPPSLNDLDALKLSTSLFGQPEVSYLSPATSVSTISQAADYGCSVLFNGHGGDAIIGNGFEVLFNAFKQRNWILLDQLLKQRVAYHPLMNNYSGWHKLTYEKQYRLVLNAFLYRQLSALRRTSLKELLLMYREVSSSMPISTSYFVKRALKGILLRAIRQNFRPETSLINNDLIQKKSKTNDRSFADALRGELPVQYKDLFDEVFHPHVIRSQEQFFALSSHFRVINRSPYMQKEFFELALTVPDDVKFGQGIGRAHLRDAMKGILTEEVRTRGTKATMSSLDGQLITQRLLEQARDYTSSGQEVWTYLDKSKFDQQAAILNNSKIPFTQKTASYFHITRAISLSVWLEWVKAQKKGH
jgi:asparagine synthase (glutamine-hydrolysing)